MPCPIETRQLFGWTLLVTEKTEAHLYLGGNPTPIIAPPTAARYDLTKTLGGRRWHSMTVTQMHLARS